MTIHRRRSRESRAAADQALAGNLSDLIDDITETEEAPADLVFADATIAERLVTEALAGRFRHAKGLGWLHWDGKRWKESQDKDAREAARQWVKAQFEGATDTWKKEIGNGSKQAADRAAENRDGWKRFLTKVKLDAIVALASGIRGVSTRPEEFDAYLDLINTQSGVVDLTTGELQPHDPDLLLTKITRAKYNPGAEHPDWKAALTALPSDVWEWYQTRLGQAITGHTPPDDVMLVQQGGGENGKTTVMGTIERALGDYYLFVPHRALLADNQAHDTELTEFRGARLAVLEELPEERRLNVTRLKRLVGTPTMTARKVFQNTLTWETSHTLIINTNYRPGVDETDHGTWRRLALVTFPYRFVAGDAALHHENDRRGDEGLRQRLRQSGDGQAEAVLAWLVAGAVRWYEAEQVLPSLPSQVAADTKEWRAESDLLYSYLSEELVANVNSHIVGEDLYEDFRAWLTPRGHKSWTSKLIAGRIEQHAVTRELGMEKRKIRPQPGRSHRPPEWPDQDLAGGASETNGPRWSWVGVRFTRDQTGLESVSASMTSSWHTEASDQPKSGLVPDVPAHPNLPKKTPTRRRVGSSRNIRNRGNSR